MWIPTPYRGRVSTDRHATPRRVISVAKTLWDAYGDVVGTSGRADDLREYMKWRVDNPDTPLPGRKLGPFKKSPKGTEKPAKMATKRTGTTG